MRDNFSTKTIEILGKRVAYRCSNPECRKPTVGPHSVSMKATIVGIAAHITAASPLGPRFDINLSKAERIDISNGIWLCVNCASLIDKDEKTFPTELIKQWKANAESEALKDIGAIHSVVATSTTTTTTTAATLVHSRPYAEADIQFVKSTKRNNGLSSNQKTVDSDGAVELDSAIWINKIGWMYELKVYNNSTAHIFNLKVSIEKSPKEFIRFDELPKVNRILPLGDVGVNLEFGGTYECTGRDSIAILENTFPNALDDLEIILEYYDSNRNKYRTQVTFSNGDIKSTHL